jgi:hypothetical protein
MCCPPKKNPAAPSGRPSLLHKTYTATPLLALTTLMKSHQPTHPKVRGLIVTGKWLLGGWVGGFSLVLSVQGEGYQCRSCGAKTIEGAAGFFLGGQHINA